MKRVEAVRNRTAELDFRKLVEQQGTPKHKKRPELRPQTRQKEKLRLQAGTTTPSVHCEHNEDTRCVAASEGLGLPDQYAMRPPSESLPTHRPPPELFEARNCRIILRIGLALRQRRLKRLGVGNTNSTELNNWYANVPICGTIHRLTSIPLPSPGSRRFLRNLTDRKGANHGAHIRSSSEEIRH